MADKKGKTLLVTTPIDMETWNKARWSGVAFIGDYSGRTLPAMGLIFENEEAGRKIFSDWLQATGSADVNEDLRVSIIEGDLPGESNPGYTVHIGFELDQVLQRAKQQGLNPENLGLITVGRIHRMNPEPGSTGLENFKAEYKKHGSYGLMPVFVKGGQAEPADELAILKHRIHFRKVEDIGANDEDAVCLKRGKSDEHSH